MIGYLNYVLVLLIVTGILILFFDVKGYNMAHMKKEEKTARYLGWFNVSVGILMFTGNWAYQMWFW